MTTGHIIFNVSNPGEDNETETKAIAESRTQVFTCSSMQENDQQEESEKWLRSFPNPK